MSLTLTKITEGFCDGNVLYHKFDTLTDEQKADIVKRKEERKYVVLFLLYSVLCGVVAPCYQHHHYQC